MLTNKATDLILGLCDKIGSKEYVIYSWEEVAKCYDKKAEISEIQELFEEARLNNCVNQKYKDDDDERIKVENINAIAKSCITQETAKVTGISTVAGILLFQKSDLK